MPQISSSRLVDLALLAYLLVLVTLSFIKSESWFSAILVAPLFVLVPAAFGIGILYLARVWQHLKSQILDPKSAIAFSYFFGSVVMTLLYYNFEVLDLLKPYFDFLALLLLAGSTIGVLILRKELKALAAPLHDPFRFDLLILVLAYLFYFVFFSEYPFRPIFQEIHFLKGALEFDKFHFLNIFTADSYIPILQLKQGLLRHFWGVDLIKMQWAIPFYTMFFHAFIINRFFRNWAATPINRKISNSLFYIFLPTIMLSNTNGDFVFFLTMLWLSSLCDSQNKLLTAKPAQMFLWLFSILSSVFLFKWSNLGYHAMIFPIAIATLLLAMSSLTSRFLAHNFAFSVLLCALALPSHRASLLFFPSALVFYLSVYATEPLSKLSISSFKWEQAATFILGVFLTLTLTLVALNLYHVFLSGPDIMRGLRRSMLYVAEFILKKKFNASATQELGNDFWNSLVELVRMLPLTFQFGLLIFFWRYLFSSKSSKNMGPSDLARTYLFFFLFISLYFSFLFIPLPFLYRGQVFLVPIGIIGLNILALSPQSGLDFPRSSKIMKFVGPLLFLSACLLLVLGAFRIQGRLNTYLLTILNLNGTIIFLTVASLLVLALKKLPQSIRQAALILILITTFGLDKLNTTVKFFQRSFGDTYRTGSNITHYSSLDFQSSEFINHLPPGPKIIFSDPVTSSNVKAMTGYNSLFTYANLSDMSNDILVYWRKNLRKLVRPGHFDESEFMKDVLTKMRGRYPEAQYAFTRLNTPLTRKTLLDNMIIVVGKRTLEWVDCERTYCEYDYFPYSDRIQLQQRLRDLLRLRFEVLDENSYRMVLRFKGRQ